MNWEEKLYKDLAKEFNNPWHVPPYWIKRWIEKNIELITKTSADKKPSKPQK